MNATDQIPTLPVLRVLGNFADVRPTIFTATGEQDHLPRWLAFCHLKVPMSGRIVSYGVRIDI